jgi:MazG family protein
MASSGKEFENLLELVRRLRAEDGCPWDRQQTPASVKRYLVEEAYEVLDAVEHQCPEHVAEELGDLIFMAVFLGHLYGEQDHFHMDQVLHGAAEKMIRRHPHVFGDLRVDSPQQVRQNWEEVKRRERPSSPLTTRLEEVPRALPALMRTYRILSRLEERLRRPLQQDIIRQQLRETLSLFLEQGSRDRGRRPAAVVGKLLLLVVASTLAEDGHPEEALAEALERFCQRVRQAEANLLDEGEDWRDFSEDLERNLWEEL